MSIIPLRIAVTFKQHPYPQAILILAGELNRIAQGAKFSQSHPNLEIWVTSTFRQTKAISRILTQAGITDRVHYESDSVDTVTNFTNMLPKLSDNHIHHVYLVTSDFHLNRSLMIAFFVFGSRGIVVTPVATLSDRQPESWFKLLRDFFRCILWLLTAQTGAEWFFVS